MITIMEIVEMITLIMYQGILEAMGYVASVYRSAICLLLISHIFKVIWREVVVSLFLSHIIS